METEIEFGNDYKIVWLKELKELVVGMVVNYSKDYSAKRKIDIRINQDVNFKHRYLCIENSINGPVIIVTKEFMEFDRDSREVGIWHEVGHVHYNHYMDENGQYTVNPNLDRLKWLERDMVAPEEIEADEFSVKKKGKVKVLEFLKYLQESRRLLNEKSDNAEKEMDLRIKLIADKQFNMINYFAYGSNLMTKQMAERCPDNKSIGIAVLKGYKWFINNRGFANIMKSPEDYVEGTIYKISEADEYSLDIKEGVFIRAYEKHYIDVNFNTETMNCLVYIDPNIKLGKPNKEYVRRLLKGKIDSKISEFFYDKYWKPSVEFQE